MLVTAYKRFHNNGGDNMESTKTNISIDLKRLNICLCKNCKAKLRELVKEAITDAQLNQVMGTGGE